MGRVTTKPVQTTFGYLFQPKVDNVKDNATGQTVQKQKWQITPIFDQDSPEQAASLQECINDAYAVGLEEFGEHFWAMVQQNSVRWPFRNGSDINPKTGQPRFSGNKVYINCSSQSKPDVVSRYAAQGDAGLKPRKIEDASEYYWGQFARVNITFKAYKRSDGRGIAAYVNGVQLWHEGERLGEGQFDGQEHFDAEGAPEAAYGPGGGGAAPTPPAAAGGPPTPPPGVAAPAAPAAPAPSAPPVPQPPQVGGGGLL